MCLNHFNIFQHSSTSSCMLLSHAFLCFPMLSLRCLAELDDLGWEKSSGSAPKATCENPNLAPVRSAISLIIGASSPPDPQLWLKKPWVLSLMQTQSKTSFGSNLITLFWRLWCNRILLYSVIIFCYQCCGSAMASKIDLNPRLGGAVRRACAIQSQDLTRQHKHHRQWARSALNFATCAL